MKYYTTIISLFFLSSILLSLLIYFGKLSNHIEKDIKKSITKINDLKEQIRIMGEAGVNKAKEKKNAKGR